MEWAHAMAPGANIMLVEASSTNDSDLFAAVSYAASHANVVSMSWGGGEFSGETAYDTQYFDHAGVAFVASSGDSGAPASYPAASPNVLSVGGTALTLGAGNVWSSEVGWSGSGGGPSAYESQPSYQKGVVTQTSTARATPDVAYDADPSTGVDVYDSVPYEGDERLVRGWRHQRRGTAVVGAAGDRRPGPRRERPIGAQQHQPAASDEHPVRKPDRLPRHHQRHEHRHPELFGRQRLRLCHRHGLADRQPDRRLAGWHVHGLVRQAGPDRADRRDGGDVVQPHGHRRERRAGRRTPVTPARSTSPAAMSRPCLPANYTFTTGTGTERLHVFTVTLKTAGSQSITATDTSTSAITGTLSGISVSPASASQFVLSGLPSTATVGVAQTVTVTAEDPYGNVATGYTGTVHFTSSDPQASLPANYHLHSGDDGTYTPSRVTFRTAGTQSVTVTDTTSGITGTSVGNHGRTGCPDQPDSHCGLLDPDQSRLDRLERCHRLPGPAKPQRQHRLVSGREPHHPPHSFQQTGLSAGTTYYFRVIATLGTIDSGYSNVASTTTTGTAPTADTIWGNSYVPSENYYSSGSYEVGVKFTASVAGEVTGVRFYKQTWMGGYVHVGHLWSSTGTLLATATFTNESAYGWQQVTFSSPVAILANTVYIASFSTGGGYFGITSPFFTSGGVTNGPLEALPNSVSGGDGVYNRAGFPDVNSNGMNFWADVAFAVILRYHCREGLFPGLALDRGGWVRSQPRPAINPVISSFRRRRPHRRGRRARRRIAGTTPAVLGSLSYRRPIPQAATLAS